MSTEEQNIEPEAPEPSPEDFELAERPRPARGILYERPKQKHVFIVAIFGIACVAASFVFWSSSTYSNFMWVSRDSLLVRHEFWRLLTATFTHGDIGHLLSNMPLVLIFGWLLRTYFGVIAFPLASLVIGALTNFATVYFYHDHLRLIGASGMLYGMVSMWSVFYLRYEIRFTLPKKLLRATGVLLVLLFPSVYDPSTSYLSHIFGFVFGILIGIGLIATGIYDRRQRALQGDHS